MPTLCTPEAPIEWGDLHILIFTSRLWGNEHPYMHKSENPCVPSSFPILSLPSREPRRRSFTFHLISPYLSCSILFSSCLFLPLCFSSLLFYLAFSSKFLCKECLSPPLPLNSLTPTISRSPDSLKKLPPEHPWSTLN